MDDSDKNSSIMCNSIAEDSLYALSISYEALRDRYNKLKAENRKLQQCKTCLRCRAAMNGSTAEQQQPQVQSLVTSAVPPWAQAEGLRLPSLPETAELIRQVADLRVKLERALSSGSSSSGGSDTELPPSLSGTVNSLLILEHQMSSRLSNPSLSIREEPEMEDDRECLDELNDLNNALVLQYDELTNVCQKLQQQNTTVLRFVEGLRERSKLPCSPVYETGNSDWSLLEL